MKGNELKILAKSAAVFLWNRTAQALRRTILPPLGNFWIRKAAAAAALAAALQISPAGGAPAQAHDLGDLSDADRIALWQEFRGYLLTNPEIIIEVLNLLEQQQAQAETELQGQAIQAHADELFNDPNSWQGGNPDGDITIVEFIDYRCGYCRKAHPEIQQLLASDPGIRFIVKELPILSQESVDSAQLALAALRHAGENAYKDVHNFLISYSGPIDSGAIDHVAQLAGIDRSVLEEDAGSPAVGEIIAANYRLAEALSISGTPAFVIGTALFPGYAPLDQMRQLIESERNNSE